MNYKKAINDLLVILIFICLFVFSFFSGNRSFGEGADYQNYYQIFSSSYYERPSIEPAFKLLRVINDFLFKSQLFSVYFFSSFISLFLVFRTHIRYSKKLIFSVVFYMLTFFILHQYTQIRAATAVGIFCWSLDDIYSNNSRMYFCKTLAALLFHYSAIIMIPFWLFTKTCKSKKILGLLVLSSFCFALIGLKIHFDILTVVKQIQLITGIVKAGSTSDFMSVFNIKYLSLLFVFFAILFFMPMTTGGMDFIMLKCLSFGLCCYYLLNPFHLPVISVRFAEFFIPVITILLANFCCINIIREKKIILLFSIIFISFYSYATIKTVFGV